MAFSWSLTDTEAITGSIDRTVKVCTNASYTIAYFTVGNKLYSWNGSTLTDLGFDTWASTNYDNEQLVDVVVFGGNLYAAFNASETGESSGFTASRIAKYTGSWTHMAELLADDLTPRPFITSSFGKARFTHLAADDNRIIAAGASSGFFFGRLFESTDGSSWSIPEISSSQIEGFPYVLGKYKDITIDVLGIEGQGSTPWTDWRVVGYSGGAWNYLSGSNIGNRTLQGYFDGKSFFSVLQSGTTWELAYSTDWGVNVTPAGGPTTIGPPSSGSATCDYYRLYDFGTDAQLMFRADVNQVYLWDTGTSQFVADSVPDASDIVYGLFRLGSNIIALCEDGSNSATFYSAALPVAPPPGFALTHSGGGIPGAIIT